MDKDVIRYENNGKTPAEREAKLKTNLRLFKQDAQAGKLLCLSDLMGQAETVHLDKASKASLVCPQPAPGCRSTSF